MSRSAEAAAPLLGVSISDYDDQSAESSGDLLTVNDGASDSHLHESRSRRRQAGTTGSIWNTKPAKALIGATVFTLIFMVAEIIGGYLAMSLAIMTDAAHLLTDVAAMCISLFAMHLSRLPANQVASYGYQRAEILGALVSVLLIWALVGVLVYEAILRLISDVEHFGEPVDGRLMAIIGGAGFLVNIIDALILRWGNAPHSHSHSHAGGGGGHAHATNATVEEGHSHGGGASGGNINVRSALIHVIGDCIQSLGVVVAALVIWLGNWYTYGEIRVKNSSYNMADPIASLLFGIITLYTTFGLLRNIMNVLMERVPPEIDFQSLLDDLRALNGVSAVHDLHVWTISLGSLTMSVHIVSDHQLTVLPSAVAVCKRYGIAHTTIQVETSAVAEKLCTESSAVHFH